jgi:DNA-binding NarL/FixJ family response regulator
MSEKIKILIADPHYLIRQGLRFIFSDKKKYKVVAETEDYTELNKLIDNSNPDVVVIGLNIHGVSAVESIESILTTRPNVKVLVLDTNENTDDIVTILRLGVHGYILKQCDHQEILDAVNSIISGKNFFCSNVINLNKKNEDNSCKGYETILHNHPALKLSSREMEILELISQGLTNNEIGDKIFISSHTVATHRKNLMKKFNAKNNVDLVICAIKERFIAP